MRHPFLSTFGALLASALLYPVCALACACGCGVFGVGAGSLLPDGSRGQVFAEYDFMDQSQNWSGASRAPGGHNPDKDISTDFVTLGGQWTVRPDWSVTVEVPYWKRKFTTDTGAGIGAFRHSAFGDVRLTGMYTGFSRDQSTGVMLGLKLPTGDFRYPHFDRDTEIGSGAADILVGAYHRAALSGDETWGWFVQGLGDLPISSRGGYAPGREFDAAAGLIYAGFSLAGGRIRIAPVAQVIGSARARDSGAAAHPGDSGYGRLILSPGVQVSSGRWRLYGDVEFPVAQHFNGNQLAAPELYKIIFSRAF